MEAFQRLLQDRRVLYGLLGLLVVGLIVVMIMCGSGRKSMPSKKEPFVDLRKLGNAQQRRFAEEVRFI